ncbi:hypothetical protein KEM55_003886 [Ascosphaera atra]|nr:hypothetical protein KEM55_003886 [Ascosphaera atra]
MPLITNDTCDPFAPRAQPCTLGNHVSYVVNVTEPAHITSTLAFARENNIRVVIHNTGHDFFGKSTGAGAIAIWTHHLKDVQVREYNDPVYSGKALKLGAGIQARDAYKAADKYDAQVVGGQCPTVGLAGGYTMGGGHSLLASTYGLAADQVLEWEVIDSNGRFMVANRTHNSDLYWALCGGGGGTFGVVWSMTVKAHRPTPISGVNLMYTNEGISQDTFWKAFERWYTVVPSLADAGAECIFSFTNTTFSLEPITAPNVPIEHVKKLLQPFTDCLEELGIKYTMDARQFPKFFDFYNAMIGNTPVGNSHFGSWLLPRKVVEGKRHDVVEASRYIANNGGAVTGFGLNVSPSVVGDIDNAVPPAWREALVHYLMGVPWELGTDRAGKIEHHARLTHDFIPRLRALAPDSGAYVNEGDFQQPDFQRVFYGKNYPRLKKIKEKYDPHGLFWGLTAVGSEGWTQHQDGRLCRT